LPEYEEELPMPAWFQSILLVALGAVVFAMVLPAFEGFGGAGAFAAYYLVLTSALALMLFAIVTFRRLTIVVGGEEVRFGFGVLRKAIPFERIKSFEAKRYDWLVYGGWGVRFSLGGRRAWSVPGVPKGVEFTVEEGRRVRRYFVSSRYPERLVEAVERR
jgi:hypothetical protein